MAAAALQDVVAVAAGQDGAELEAARDGEAIVAVAAICDQARDRADQKLAVRFSIERHGHGGAEIERAEGDGIVAGAAMNDESRAARHEWILFEPNDACLIG